MTDEALKAWDKICAEFIAKYYEWRSDLLALNDHDYSWKYGYAKPTKDIKDNLTGVHAFAKYIFSGRYLPAWEAAGYSKSAIWELHSEGLLSLDYHSNWYSRATHKEYFYYITQAKAKEIYKAYKSGGTT